MKTPKPIILFIDDDRENLETFRDLYQEYFELISTTNVKDGLRVLQKREVAVVVTDIRMPGLDGMDFLTIANEQFRKPIKIVLSGYVEDFFSDAFQTKYRPYCIVRKPVEDPHGLLKILLEAVREYEFRYGALTQAQEPGFLSAHDILKRLGISKPTLYKYLKSGLPSQRVGGRRLFDWQAVSNWVKSHEVRSLSER